VTPSTNNIQAAIMAQKNYLNAQLCMYIPLGKVDLYLDVSLRTTMVVNLAKLWLLNKIMKKR